jgi:tetratricopeptide (TPR) repeat protein
MEMYADLEIGLLRRDDHFYVVEFRFRQPNSEADVRFGHDQLLQISIDPQEFIQLGYDLKAYSQKLTQLFFAEPAVETAFAQARASSQTLGVPLRMRLMIDPSAIELHGLRWETLCDPQDGNPLSISENLLFSRYLSSLDWRPVHLRPHDKLSALVVVANPSDLAYYNLEPVNVEAEIERAHQGLGDIPMTTLPDPTTGQLATLNNLVDQLRQGEHDILYLVSHGAQALDESWLWLQDEHGKVGRASGADIVTRLNELEQRPNLVVMASCESAGDGSDVALASLGPRLAEAGIPAVLAMQGKISMQTMAKFMPVFFRELRRDGQIDRALAVARGAVRQRSDWWMPVLFSRLRDNHIFPSNSQDKTTLTSPGPMINISGNVVGDVNIELSGPIVIDATDLPIPAPPTPEPLPDIADFVGRQQELSKFKEQLHSAHLAVICGMAGVGKTKLAAVLAQQTAPSQNIFWHTFHQGEGVESIIWQLAGFLARHGQDDLWQLLQRTQLTKGALPPTETLLDYLLQMLRGRDYLLCLDDIHIVEEDPQLSLFIERTRALIFAGDLTVIITSRVLPDYVTSVETAFMPGLSLETTRQILLNREVELADELTKKLHQRTNGNAELVILSSELLRQASNPDRLLENLSEAADVERFVLSEVDAHLSDLEPEVMSAVSLLNFFGHMSTRYAIAAILEGQSVRRTLRDLADRFLLIVQQDDRGTEYGQHSIVREFYYDTLDRRQRQVMHHLAGRYYLEEESYPVRAAFHYEIAGEVGEVVRLITGDVWTFINQGQGRSLRVLLDRLDQRNLDTSEWLQVKLAQGEVYAFFGESDQAQNCYQEVISQLEAQPDEPSFRSQKVRAYHGLGELLQQESPQEALNWLRQGLAEIDGTENMEEARLHLTIGTTLMWLGNYTEAAIALEKSLSLLPDKPSQWRATALENLGVIAIEQRADFESGIALTHEALAISQHMRDHFKTIEILNSLASYKWNAGDWQGAMDDFYEARVLAEQIGSEKALAGLVVNLGSISIDHGDYIKARQHLETGLKLSQKTHQIFLENICVLSLAELELRLGNWEEASRYLRDAEQLNAQHEDKVNALIIRRGWAQIKLAAGENEMALEDAQLAVDLASEVGELIELGINYRILGQVFLAQNQRDDAYHAFQQSDSILKKAYPYEAARTQMQWGLTLLAEGNTKPGYMLLDKAQATFRALGAQSELAAVEQSLQD